MAYIALRASPLFYTEICKSRVFSTKRNGLIFYIVNIKIGTVKTFPNLFHYSTPASMCIILQQTKTFSRLLYWHPILQSYSLQPPHSRGKCVINKGKFDFDLFSSFTSMLYWNQASHVYRNCSHPASHHHTDYLYTISTLYHCITVSTITLSARSHCLSYYHADISKMSTAWNRYVTVITVISPRSISLFSAVLQGSRYMSAAPYLHVCISVWMD